MKPTLVIGDLHGHLDRFEALLIQEGILGECPDCDSLGQTWNGPCEEYECEYACSHDLYEDCQTCDGTGTARINHDVEVVQLGDFGHWGSDGSGTGDILTAKYAFKWCDVVLWGNHDRAIIDRGVHDFRGFMMPGPEAKHLIKLAQSERKLRLAHSSHGYLFTHAGLHMAFRDQDLPQYLKEDAKEFASWLNVNDILWNEGHPEAVGRQFIAIRDAVGRARGGGSHAGGIIWRDITEKLYMGFPQVFGHSADKQHEVRVCAQKGYFRTRQHHEPGFLSYCVDVGGKGDKPGDECLAGIWLPDERIVRVDL